VRFSEAGEPLANEDQQLLEAVTNSAEYLVRVYVLRGLQLAMLDDGGNSKSDPYLVATLGTHSVDCRSEYIADVTDARFFRLFEFETRLPGDSLLRIDVMDRDSFGRASDDLIGATTIDLEDRIFSPRWRDDDLGSRPPVEWRSLYSPTSKHEQGKLELWVDIQRTRDASGMPIPRPSAFDIAPPPEQKWELRVIVWSGRNLPDDLDDSGLADFYVTVKFLSATQVLETSTDTHFRAANGKASWNWRCKFPVSLDSFLKDQRLELYLWDKDILPNSDDVGGSSTLLLTHWLKQLFRRGPRAHAEYWDPPAPEAKPVVERLFGRRGAKERSGRRQNKWAEEAQTQQVLQPHKAEQEEPSSLASAAEHLLTQDSLLAAVKDEEVEEAKLWVPLQRPKRADRSQFGNDGSTPPELLITVQMVPAFELDKLPAGAGRSEPNANPVLPKPIGRLHFTLNPFAMCYQLIGARMCRRLMGLFSCLVCVLSLYYMLPVIFGNLLTAFIPFVASG